MIGIGWAETEAADFDFFDLFGIVASNYCWNKGIVGNKNTSELKVIPKV